MRIALISFTHIYNYGANFQAVALEKYIENTYKKIDCKYICYNRNFIGASIKWLWRKTTSQLIRINDDPSWTIKEYIKTVFQRLGEGLYAGTNEKFKKFWKLMSYDLHNGKPYRKSNLNGLNKRYDKFISGSDQIWNCGKLDLDTTYMLDFVTDDSKKFSYASSLGMREIPKKYYLKYKKCLSSFKELSCREQEGADLISELTGRDVIHVLDPVFLLDEEDWIKLSKLADEVCIPEKYILVYTLSISEEFINAVKSYAENNDEPVLVISNNNCNGKSTGPLEWLYYFSHADEIFTDSFHGTAFSVIFNKQFSVYIPDDSFFQDSKARITGLLDDLEIRERIIDDTYCFEELKEIDYDSVNAVLSQLKEKSKSYLDKCLKE